MKTFSERKSLLSDKLLNLVILGCWKITTELEQRREVSWLWKRKSFKCAWQRVFQVCCLGLFTLSFRLLSPSEGNKSRQTWKHKVQLIGWCRLCIRAANGYESNLSPSILVLSLCVDKVLQVFGGEVWDEDVGVGAQSWAGEQALSWGGLGRRAGEADGGCSKGGAWYGVTGEPRLLQTAGGRLIAPVGDFTHLL